MKKITAEGKKGSKEPPFLPNFVNFFDCEPLVRTNRVLEQAQSARRLSCRAPAFTFEKE
jgi:hypothetical protein